MDAMMRPADLPATSEGVAVAEMVVATDDNAAQELGATPEADVSEVSAPVAAVEEATTPPATGVADEVSAALVTALEPIASPENDVSPPEAHAAPEVAAEEMAVATDDYGALEFDAAPIADVPPEPHAVEAPAGVTEAEPVEEETQKSAESETLAPTAVLPP